MWLAAACAGEPLLELPADTWEGAGWFALRAFLPHPVPEPGRDEVAVYVRTPEGTTLHTEVLSDGRVGLVFPPGSEADRVARRDGRVVDVRGDRIAPDGARWHHVYQRLGGELRGVAWPAGDGEAAGRALAKMVGDFAAHRAPSWEARFLEKADCDGCHQIDRPQNRRPGEHGLVNRGTDRQGWFTPAAVLALELPAERYGEVEVPAGATVSCDATPACADGEVARWSTRTPDAAWCGSVRWVRDHLDPSDPAMDSLLNPHPCLIEADTEE